MAFSCFWKLSAFAKELNGISFSLIWEFFFWFFGFQCFYAAFEQIMQKSEKPKT